MPRRVSSFARRLVRRPRGSVLIIVLVTMVFASLAIVAFMEKAGNDLLVDAREFRTRTLRQEAFSALETTLAVLEDFRSANGGLRNPSEGWADPLGWASYVPLVDSRTVEVAFDDESGKLPLPRTQPTTFINLFMQWGLVQSDAEKLTDELMGWMTPNYNYQTAVFPTYDQGALPYVTPGRPLRSYSELSAIDYAREVFFDADGHPTDLYWRFMDDVSLFNFQTPNINNAKPDVMAALGQFDETQQKNAKDYISGTGTYQSQGPGWFRNASDVSAVIGATGNPRAFSTSISALRITVTVHEGRNQYRLSVVIAPQGGATTTTTTATMTRNPTSAAANQQTQQQQQAALNGGGTNSSPNNAAANANTRRLNYPFTILDLRENDAIPSPPPPPPSADNVP